MFNLNTTLLLKVKNSLHVSLAQVAIIWVNVGGWREEDLKLQLKVWDIKITKAM
jgi:hypothetical protein